MLYNFIGLFTFFILSYILGSILFCVIIGKIVFKIDIRLYGSKSAGATNLERVATHHKKLWSRLGTWLDIAKAYCSVLLCALLYKFIFIPNTNATWDWIIYIPIIGATLGHSFPIAYVFMLIKTQSFEKAKAYRGGKSITTFGGGILTFNPIIAVSLMALLIILKKITHYTSVASIITAFVAPFASVLIFQIPGYAYFTWKTSLACANDVNIFSYTAFVDLWILFIINMSAALIVIARHHSNISRLLKGIENKIPKKGKHIDSIKTNKNNEIVRK